MVVYTTRSTTRLSVSLSLSPLFTPFPYTTLFRSLVAPGAALMDGARQELLAGAALAGDQHARIGSGDHERQGELFLDRKSTRLNSSHMSISYAVFCLKKK